jgi:hypothetical protein
MHCSDLEKLATFVRVIRVTLRCGRGLWGFVFGYGAKYETIASSRYLRQLTPPIISAAAGNLEKLAVLRAHIVPRHLLLNY